jgi:hypothetical protein
MDRYIIYFSNNIKLITEMCCNDDINKFALSLAKKYGKIYKLKLNIIQIIKI